MIRLYNGASYREPDDPLLQQTVLNCPLSSMDKGTCPMRNSKGQLNKAQVCQSRLHIYEPLYKHKHGVVPTGDKLQLWSPCYENIDAIDPFGNDLGTQWPERSMASYEGPSFIVPLVVPRVRKPSKHPARKRRKHSAQVLQQVELKAAVVQDSDSDDHDLMMADCDQPSRYEEIEEEWSLSRQRERSRKSKTRNRNPQWGMISDVDKMQDSEDDVTFETEYTPEDGLVVEVEVDTTLGCSICRYSSHGCQLCQPPPTLVTKRNRNCQQLEKIPEGSRDGYALRARGSLRVPKYLRDLYGYGIEDSEEPMKRFEPTHQQKRKRPNATDTSIEQTLQPPSLPVGGTADSGSHSESPQPGACLSKAATAIPKSSSTATKSNPKLQKGPRQKPHPYSDPFWNMTTLPRSYMIIPSFNTTSTINFQSLCVAGVLQPGYILQSHGFEAQVVGPSTSKKDKSSQVGRPQSYALAIGGTRRRIGLSSFLQLAAKLSCSTPENWKTTAASAHKHDWTTILLEHPRLGQLPVSKYIDLWCTNPEVQELSHVDLQLHLLRERRYQPPTSVVPTMLSPLRSNQSAASVSENKNKQQAERQQALHDADSGGKNLPASKATDKASVDSTAVPAMDPGSISTTGDSSTSKTNEVAASPEPKLMVGQDTKQPPPTGSARHGAVVIPLCQICNEAAPFLSATGGVCRECLQRLVISARMQAWRHWLIAIQAQTPSSELQTVADHIHTPSQVLYPPPADPLSPEHMQWWQHMSQVSQGRSAEPYASGTVRYSVMPDNLDD
uniref:Uncharacterized protein n=1 Tax=Eutreptiella gymnastica TaxID=73025 RepID=A0A7S1JHL8_9EUGL|mmetsp:Transcript_95300/g.164478  ORF Transcript_95300/g.164478 Transcript_95300/m.164478 type:complete len:782 (+) Transcript_95300:81-2426(+)